MYGLNGCLGVILEDSRTLFWVYAPISPITLVLACSGFFISEHISTQVMGKKDEVEAKWIKEGCKRGPLSPRRKIQGKIRGSKRCTKTQRSGSGRTDWAGATTASLWCSPQPVVVDAWPFVPPALGCFDSFAAFWFLARFFSILATVLSLKEHVSRSNFVPFIHHYPSA